MSSNNLDKYEYLTGKDLGLKPSAIEQTKFEYPTFGKILRKGWVRIIKKKDFWRG